MLAISGDSGSPTDFTYSGNTTIQLTDKSITFYYTSTVAYSSQAIHISVSSDADHTISLSYIAIVLIIMAGLVVSYGLIAIVRFCCCRRDSSSILTVFQSREWIEQSGARLGKILSESPEGFYQPGNRYSQATCSICLADFTPMCAIRVLICSHIFHKDCIESWIKAKIGVIPRCPMCNAELTRERPPGFVDAGNATALPPPVPRVHLIQPPQPAPPPEPQLPVHRRSDSLASYSI